MYNVNPSELEQWEIDKYIEEIKENENELKKYENIFKKRVYDLELQYKEKKEKIEQKNNEILYILGEYAKQQEDLKSTKTQYKWESLSGDIIIKKSLPKTKRPAKDKMEIIEEKFPEFIKKEEVKKLDWRGMQKNIILQNGVPYDKETGEDLSDIVGVEISEERIQIK